MHESAVSQHGVHESAVGVNHNAQPADYFPTGLTAIVLATRDSTFFFTNLFKYFSCEAFGHDPEMPCDPNTFRQYTHTGILAAAHILVMLFPAINLLYVLNVKELREACHMTKKPSFCQ